MKRYDEWVVDLTWDQIKFVLDIVRSEFGYDETVYILRNDEAMSRFTAILKTLL
jgi:hypothetical protein